MKKGKGRRKTEHEHKWIFRIQGGNPWITVEDCDCGSTRIKGSGKEEIFQVISGPSPMSLEQIDRLMFPDLEHPPRSSADNFNVYTNHCSDCQVCWEAVVARRKLCAVGESLYSRWVNSEPSVTPADGSFPKNE